MINFLRRPNSDALKLVVTDGMKPILAGVAIGLAAALALSRLIASLLFPIHCIDPITFSAAALILIAVGIMANLLPAYRATASNQSALCATRSCILGIAAARFSASQVPEVALRSG